MPVPVFVFATTPVNVYHPALPGVMLTIMGSVRARILFQWLLLLPVHKGSQIEEAPCASPSCGPVRLETIPFRKASTQQHPRSIRKPD